MTICSGDADIMIRSGSAGLDLVDATRVDARHVDDAVSLAASRCDGVVADSVVADLFNLADRWSTLDNTLMEVGVRFLEADRAIMASIRENGIQTPFEARHVVRAGSVLDQPLDDPAAASLVLFAVAGVADSARDRARGDSDGDDGVVSVDDLEAMVDDSAYSDFERTAAARLIEFIDGGDGRSEALGIKDGGWDWSSFAGDALEMASFVPVVGDVVDAASLIYYLSQGDWENALVSGIGLVPVPGVSGTGIRATKEAVERLAQTAGAGGTRAVMREVADETAENVVFDHAASNVGEVVETVTGSERLGDLAGTATAIRLDVERSDGVAQAVAGNVSSMAEFGLDLGSSAEPDSEQDTVPTVMQLPSEL